MFPKIEQVENRIITTMSIIYIGKKVREKSRECHNHKPQPFPDPKRKRKPTNLNKHKPNKRTKSTKISSLFPKRGNRKTKKTEKTQEQNVTRKDIQQIAGFKAHLQLANFTLGPDATLNTEIHKIRFAYRLPTQSMNQSENIKIKLMY